MTAVPPLRVAIGRISVGAASGLDARRLADALPGAIERALGRLAADGGAPTPPGRTAAAADRVAAEVAAIVDARMRDKR